MGTEEITPFGGLEPDQVTPEDYRRAYRSLCDFLEVEASKIKSLDDLSARASLIGDDLKTIVLGSGEIETTRFDFQDHLGETHQAVDRSWVIRKPVGDHKICVTNSHSGIYITEYEIVNNDQLSIFAIHLPLRSEYKSNGDILSDQSFIYATDWRNNDVVSYYPAVYPNDSKVQQGFTIILQEAIRKVLKVVLKP